MSSTCATPSNCESNGCGNSRNNDRSGKTAAEIKSDRSSANINKQKYQKDVCSKCPNKLDVKVGTNGRYCKTCFVKYCTDKMRKAMSKSNGVDLREEQRAVLAVKSSYKGSFSSMALLLLFNELQGEAKKFKCLIDEIVCVYDKKDMKKANLDSDFKDERLESIIQNLKNIEKFKVTYLKEESSDSSSRITANKSLITYLISKNSESSINYVLTGYTTTTIAGNILSQVTDGAGEHISYSSSSNEVVENFAFLKPFRDLSKNDLKNAVKVVSDLSDNLSNLSISPLNDQKLDPSMAISTSNVLKKELKMFLNDLDEEYPAQIFAVYRIGVKLIGDNTINDTVCKNCYRKTNYNYDSSAMTALDFCRKFDTNANFKVEDLLTETFTDNFENDGTFRNEESCYKCLNN